MSEQLISISVTGLPYPLTFRANELIPIKSRADYTSRRYLRKYRNVKRRSVTDFDLPTRYVQSREVGTGDWILLPRRPHLLPSDLTTDQLYVSGFWLAEGHHLKESKKGTSTFGKPVGICLTNTNRSLLEKAQIILHDWFPKSASHIRTEHLGNPKYRAKHVLELQSRDASNFFFPNFGEYSFGKFISPAVFDRSGLLPLVCGFIDGDGSQFRKGRHLGQVALTSTSEKLIHQLRQILIDEGIWTVLQFRDHSNPKHNRTYLLSIVRNYVPLLSGADKVIPPEVERTNNLAIPTPEGFFARVKSTQYV